MILIYSGSLGFTMEGSSGSSPRGFPKNRYSHSAHVLMNCVIMPPRAKKRLEMQS
jgi:hypothetical protein